MPLVDSCGCKRNAKHARTRSRRDPRGVGEEYRYLKTAAGGGYTEKLCTASQRRV
jgi:hypothetical protein